jgi:3-keto-disaccharide hydrolase
VLQFQRSGILWVMRIPITALIAFALGLADVSLAPEQSAPKPAPPQHAHDTGAAIKGSGKLPAGWNVRFDDPSAKVEQVVVEEKDGSLTFTTGPAGIYWKNDKAEKDFDISAAFSQLKPSGMAEAYGLFLAGQDLDKDTQRYTYFLVRQDGKFLIKTRNGATTKTIVDWTSAPSMKEPKGVKTSNTLEIRATANSVQFVVDGKPVHAMTRTQLGPDGVAGIRVNHNLNLQVSKFAVKKLN